MSRLRNVAKLVYSVFVRGEASISGDGSPAVDLPVFNGEAKKAFSTGNPELRDLPDEIYIEPAMACNLGCEMCPVPRHSTEMGGRFRSIMKLDTFKAVLRSVAGRSRTLWLNQLGEPLLNKNIVEFVRLAKEHGHTVGFTTNGTLMTDDLAKRLLAAGIDKVCFSFDGGTKATFEKIRIGGNFEGTLGNIQNFSRLAEERDPPCAVEVHMIVSDATENEVEQFRALFGSGAKVIPLDDWSGQLEIPDYFGPPRTPRESVARYRCDLLWTTSYVSAEGNVMVCCHDYKHSSKLPNVNEKSFDAIWREELRDLRQSQVNGDYSRAPCQHCRAWKTRPAPQ